MPEEQKRKLVTQVKLVDESPPEGCSRVTVGYVEDRLATVGERLQIGPTVWIVAEVWSSGYYGKNGHIAWIYKAKRAGGRDDDS
jgi:hypothetical protein